MSLSDAGRPSGLLPSAPLTLNPDVPNLRRAVFPKVFVEAVADIANERGLGPRLDRRDWARFHEDIMGAYEHHVLPLFHGVGSWDGSDAPEHEGGQANGHHMK